MSFLDYHCLVAKIILFYKINTEKEDKDIKDLCFEFYNN